MIPHADSRRPAGTISVSLDIDSEYLGRTCMSGDEAHLLERDACLLRHQLAHPPIRKIPLRRLFDGDTEPAMSGCFNCFALRIRLYPHAYIHMRIVYRLAKTRSDRLF